MAENAKMTRKRNTLEIHGGFAAGVWKDWAEGRAGGREKKRTVAEKRAKAMRRAADGTAAAKRGGEKRRRWGAERGGSHGGMGAEVRVNAFVHRDYTMYGSEVHVDIYPDRLEVVSPGGMPDGSLVQELDLRNVASDRRNPILADLFAQMDYMERKGSGFGTILDAYEKEAPNPRGLKPEFFSTSGFFRVVLPNLNREAGLMSGGSGGKGSDESRETINETVNETVRAVEEVIVANPGVKIISIVAKIGKSRATVARALATLKKRGRIVYRGSDKTGGYFAKEG